MLLGSGHGGIAMQHFRNLALWILVGLLAVLLFNLFQGTSEPNGPPPISYSQFRQEVSRNDVRTVTFQGDQAHGRLSDGSPFTTMIPANDQSLWPLLAEHNVTVRVAPEDDGMPPLLSVLLNWFPMLLLIGVWVYFLRKMRVAQPPADAQISKPNWRRGLLRTWIVGSVLWLVAWAGMIWDACQVHRLCWLGPFQVPGLRSWLYASPDSMTAWYWAVLAIEGLAVPVLAFVLGFALLWALEGFKNEK